VSETIEECLAGLVVLDARIRKLANAHAQDRADLVRQIEQLRRERDALVAEREALRQTVKPLVGMTNSPEDLDRQQIRELLDKVVQRLRASLDMPHYTDVENRVISAFARVLELASKEAFQRPEFAPGDKVRVRSMYAQENNAQGKITARGFNDRTFMVELRSAQEGTADLVVDVGDLEHFSW
jgi:hypothetical protein